MVYWWAHPTTWHLLYRYCWINLKMSLGKYEAILKCVLSMYKISSSAFAAFQKYVRIVITSICYALTPAQVTAARKQPPLHTGWSRKKAGASNVYKMAIKPLEDVVGHRALRKLIFAGENVSWGKMTWCIWHDVRYIQFNQFV